MPCRTCSLAALATVGLSLISLTASAQNVIDTLYTATRAPIMPDNSQWGQTFRLPEGASRLDSFWYRLLHNRDSTQPDDAPLVFTTSISEWDPVASRPVGSPLHTSGTLSIHRSEQAPLTDLFRIPTGGLVLDPNKQYVAYMNIPNRVPPPINPGPVLRFFSPVNETNIYSGGHQVYTTNPGSNEAWRNGVFGPNSDMEFRALFDMPYHANVALGKPVTLNGAFGSSPALASTLTDGNYLPAGTPRQSGTIWWDNFDASTMIDLGGLYSINALNIQADDNDAYYVEYRRTAGDAWRGIWSVINVDAGLDGMQVRPDPGNNDGRFFLYDPIFASAFRITSRFPSNTDGHFALSEFQAYGFAVVPEPGNVALLFGMASVSGVILRRRRK